MKSAEAVGPSKNASHEWSAGLMTRLRPSLVISTWRTFGGKAMDFGKRTAWLRFVVKTVERVTCSTAEVRDPNEHPNTRIELHIC